MGCLLLCSFLIIAKKNKRLAPWCSAHTHTRTYTQTHAHTECRVRSLPPGLAVQLPLACHHVGETCTSSDLWPLISVVKKVVHACSKPWRGRTLRMTTKALHGGSFQQAGTQAVRQPVKKPASQQASIPPIQRANHPCNEPTTHATSQPPIQRANHPASKPLSQPTSQPCHFSRQPNPRDPCQTVPRPWRPRHARTGKQTHTLFSMRACIGLAASTFGSRFGPMTMPRLAGFMKFSPAWSTTSFMSSSSQSNSVLHACMHDGATHTHQHTVVVVVKHGGTRAPRARARAAGPHARAHARTQRTHSSTQTTRTHARTRPVAKAR
jgi:hypothetical protein